VGRIESGVGYTGLYQFSKSSSEFCPTMHQNGRLRRGGSLSGRFDLVSFEGRSRIIMHLGHSVSACAILTSVSYNFICISNYQATDRNDEGMHVTPVIYRAGTVCMLL